MEPPHPLSIKLRVGVSSPIRICLDVRKFKGNAIAWCILYLSYYVLSNYCNLIKYPLIDT